MGFKLTLAYDGTSYFGWQKTKMGPSIQESLEKALFQISQETVLPEAASRTDRGVHAEGQIIHFSLQKPFEPERLQMALNARLPPDIRALKLTLAPPSFHPTLDALGKQYDYRLCLSEVQEPLFRLYSWHVRKPLDLDKMKQASRDLLGSHDFSAFANEPEKNPLCTLQEISFTPLPDNLLQISIRGDRFLYKMARNLVGALVYIGLNKLAHTSIPSLLASRDRKRGAMTAPAHGLFLHRVFYPV